MGGKSYKMPLDENNECAVPWEVLVNPGTVLVSVYSGNRITATSARVQVIQSGYTDKITATQNPTIDVYASLMNRINEIANDSVYLNAAPDSDVEAMLQSLGLEG